MAMSRAVVTIMLRVKLYANVVVTGYLFVLSLSRAASTCEDLSVNQAGIRATSP